MWVLPKCWSYSEEGRGGLNMYLLPVALLASLFPMYFFFIFFGQIENFPVSSGQISGNPPRSPKAERLKTPKNRGCRGILDGFVAFIKILHTSSKISINQFIIFWFILRAGTAQNISETLWMYLTYSVRRVKSPSREWSGAWRRKRDKTFSVTSSWNNQTF